MTELRFLWHTISIEGDEADIARVRQLLAPAEYPMPPTRAMSYRVDRTNAAYAVHEEGDLLTTATTASDAADALDHRIRLRALEFASRLGWVRVRAVTVDVDGARTLVVGPSGEGGVKLAGRMLVDGLDVQGDESVLIKAGGSLAVPRTCSVTTSRPAGGRSPLHLVEAPVDHVVLIDLAAPPQGEPTTGASVLEALVRHSVIVTESRAVLVERLAPVASAAAGHRLASGPPDEMIAALRRLVAR